MCKWGKSKLVRVKIPADLSCTGRERWRKVKIDSCIAPIVRALQKDGIDMRGSCCGHGKREGQISLQDGRGLLVLDAASANLYMAYCGQVNIGQYLLSVAKRAKRRRFGK
jgi:hypothetical protein